jgi:hypothetical protein
MDISSSNTEEQQNTNNNDGNIKLKAIGCKLTEEELQNIITPVMHDCYNLGLVKLPTVYILLCNLLYNFWMGHYRMSEIEKAQQMSWSGLERSLTKASSMTRKQHNTTTPIIKQGGGYDSTAADSGNNVYRFSYLPVMIIIFVVVVAFYSAPISLSV